MSKLRTDTGWIARQAFKEIPNSIKILQKDPLAGAKIAGKAIVSGAKKVGGAIKNSLKKTWDIETKVKQNQKWQEDARKKVLERDKGEADLNN